ncbi:hypothetical protein AB0K60_06910 [Thermopolyspora sp. NPDC052614]|uniref:hypothetical protein n=1 Tax=Thermopolyspora sp. NPDC052614 TaxID=3155682 RepID=UPI0034415C26
MALCTLLSGCSSGSEPTSENSKNPKKTSEANARPPATTPTEATRILRAYLAAMSKPDTAASKSVEASTARTVHAVRLRLGEDVTPSLAPEFAIPRFSSYPRWFAAGAVRPGMTGDVAIFVQSRKDAPWRVHHVAYLSRPMPELSRDAEGYVTVADPGSVPVRQSKIFTDALIDPSVIADRAKLAGSAEGDADNPVIPVIDGLRQNSKLFAASSWQIQTSEVTQTGRSYALKTKDGGAVVWYALQYNFKAVNVGRRFEITLADEAVRMLGGRPAVSRLFAWSALYQSVAHAPATGDAKVLGVFPGWANMVGA